MAIAELTLFGGFELRLAGGQVVDVLGQKDRALLAIMALPAGVTHSRDKLASLLWSDRGDQQARDSLRHALTNLRQCISSVNVQPIMADRLSARLDPTAVTIDVTEFERSVRHGTPAALDRATALYRGDLLDGIGIHDPAFEEWLLVERQRLRHLFEEALTRQITQSMADGTRDRADAAARRLLSLDPLREEACRALMLIHAERGETAQALKLYEALRERLHAELGVKPAPETTKLYQENQSRQLHVLRAPAAAPGLPHSVENPTAAIKSSLAVLPFTNMSGDQNQAFFADGMTEDLITALSRIRELLVLPRTSTSAYKGYEAPFGKVASELGVRYVLSGSVRAASNKVRVTAQLIDCVAGSHVWAENFDGKLDDIFAVQDEITRNIVLALQIKLTSGETARLWEGQTTNLRAWEKMVLARDKFSRFDVADNRRAQRLLEESLQIDPNYTGAMLQLGMTYYWEGRYITFADKEKCGQLIEQQVDNILRIDPDMGSAFMLKGCLAMMRGRHEEAIRFCQTAVELAPGDSWNVAILATAYVYNGDSDKAVALLRTAMRLSPCIPPWHTYYFVLANLWNGDLVTAREAAEAYLRQEPDEPYGYVNLALVYGFDRREADAARIVLELRKKSPEFGIRDVLFSQCYRQRERLDRVVEVLRRAGLPG